MSERNEAVEYHHMISGGFQSFEAELRMEANKRRAERESAERQAKWERDRKAAEAEEKRRKAEADRRAAELQAESRAIAKAALDEKVAKIEQAYLNAGGDPKKWPAFRDAKVADLLANQISERERKAQRDAIDVIRGNINTTGSSGFRTFDV